MDLMQEGKHSLDEADHQIVPHSTDFAQNYPEIILDTGVLVLLTAFHAEIPAAKTLLRFALKSHINAFLASDDDILRALLPLVMTHMYQTVFSDKRSLQTSLQASQP